MACYSTTVSNGTLPPPFTILSLLPGDYNITVYSNATGDNYYYQGVLFTLYPGFSPTSGFSGYKITFNIPNGVFAPYSSVEVYFNSTYVTTVSANATGGLNVKIQIPYNLTAANYTIYLIGTAPSGTPINVTSGVFSEKFSLSPALARREAPSTSRASASSPAKRLRCTSTVLSLPR
ncbi:hypothetical protein [Vulcanisaeta distributa]|uniref:hypothetical protein n=1 Tax=Vulcanisaeta distributa TaxID=164451 RepID=UPI000AEA1F7B|nr:hypothetical protein [Vulcanisaeta distributa]